MRLETSSASARAAIVSLGALLPTLLFGGSALAATPVAAHFATALVPADSNGNTNWGCVSSNAGSVCDERGPTQQAPEDGCRGGYTNTGIPGFDQVGKTGYDIGHAGCEYMEKFTGGQWPPK
jgi:hypothetical protein